MSIAEKRQTDIGLDVNQGDVSSKKAKVQGNSTSFSTALSFKETLINHPVENLGYKKKGGLVFYVDRTDKVADVFKGLIEHGFLSVPVLQKTKHKWYGFVELSDIVQFYVEKFGEELGIEGRSALDAIGKSEEFKEKTVDDVMKYPLTRQNIFHPVTAGYSLWYAIEALAREEHLHRVPIIDSNRQLKSVLSQSQVVEFLRDNIDSLGSIKDLPVIEMRNVVKPVVSVSEETRAIEAFKLMQQNNLTGLAVLNAQGTLVGNLSVRDLKGLRLENQLFHRLFQTCHNFLRRLREERPEGDARPKRLQTVKLTDTLSTVVQGLVDHNIHRMYIVDDNNRPMGVVSLKDVLFELITL